MKRVQSARILVAVMLLASVAASARAGDTPAPKTLSEQLAAMKFRCIGPYRGGRSCAVTGVRGEPSVFYMGATGGGVWKTEDAGSTWRPISDKFFKTGSVGAIAVAESDHNVVYAGMGESAIRGNVSHGDGVYRSTDRGKTWQHMGLAETHQISRVRVHPTDPNLVYVAAQGHVWGPNPERGVYRSKDGGKTWEKVLYVSDKTGASDLCMDPTNPRILYAGMWQVQRKPWALLSGGTEGGLFKSTDAGDTWKKLEGGLPTGVVGNVGVAVSPVNPDRIWALVEAEKGGVYRSDDGGEKWTLINSDNSLRQRAWYYTKIYADTRSADTVYVLNVNFHRSNDGGQSFSVIGTNHGDHHDLWIDPDVSTRMIIGDDGGGAVSVDNGASWSSLNNQPTGQFYRVTTDDRYPYWVYGAQQDNTTIAIKSRSNDSGIGESDWHPVGGGESGWIAPKPGNPDVVYAGEYGGSISRYDNVSGQSREITAWPQLAIGQAPKDLRYRFQWNAPIIASKHEPNTVYHGAQVLLRTRDEGQTWEEVSSDLTRNDKTKQDYSGGPITRDNTGVELYDSIFAVTESPREPGTIWVGSDDGLVHVTRDSGKSWQNVTPKGMPEWIQINSIDASAHDPATAYVAATMYKNNDFRPYLYKTNDYGKTWTKITTGIPETAFTRVIREDPQRKGLLFAGTETGLYVSLDDGANWQPFQQNLPIVPITDMTIKNGDLVVATQGRAFWILDDLTPLRSYSAATAASTRLFVFDPRPAVRWDGGGSFEGSAPALGENPPNGVAVSFWLREKLGEKETLKIEFLEGDTVLRTFSSEKREPGPDDPADAPLPLKDIVAGDNRVVWDMRLASPKLVPKAVIWGSRQGPRVSPGTYAVRFTLGTETVTKPFDVVPNPTVKVTAAELRQQFELLRTLRDELQQTHDAVRGIRDVKAQMKDVVDRAKRIGKGAGLDEKAKTLDEKLTAIERKLVNPDIKSSQDVLNFPPALDHQIVGIATVVSSADARPTDASVLYARDVAARLAAVLAELNQAYATDLAPFNQAIRDAGIPPIVVAETAK